MTRRRVTITAVANDSWAALVGQTATAYMGSLLLDGLVKTDMLVCGRHYHRLGTVVKAIR